MTKRLRSYNELGFSSATARVQAQTINSASVKRALRGVYRAQGSLARTRISRRRTFPDLPYQEPHTTTLYKRTLPPEVCAYCRRERPEDLVASCPGCQARRWKLKE